MDVVNTEFVSLHRFLGEGDTLYWGDRRTTFCMFHNDLSVCNVLSYIAQKQKILKVFQCRIIANILSV